MKKRAIFWFRQDLRTFDNTWLISAIKKNDEVLPVFILDKNLVWDFGWLWDQKFGFLREMLEKLSDDIKSKSNTNLKVFYDFPEQIIPFLVKKYDIKSVYINKSYWQYWKKRDEKIQEILWDLNVDFKSYDDFLIVPVYKVPQRKVFTLFFKLWKTFLPLSFDLEYINDFKSFKIDENFEVKDFINISKHPFFTLDFLQDRLKNFDILNYNKNRNNLDIDWTSKLSPFIRFGVVSIRELYLKFKDNETFLSEIAWREFWQHIDFYFPETKKIEFQESKRHIKWQQNDDLFEKFCNWQTWYPIVDSCIKQLLTTNRMHGRGRMIVASFLTKDLHIDWREWEKFFKKYLLDYDENMNFWNWQWSASVWRDPKPLRIFNPILQSQKFDSNAIFIKKYIPILQNEDLKAIHDPIKYELNYTKPIVDHNIEQKLTRQFYKNNI